MAEPNRVKVTVSVDDEHRQQLDQVVMQLRAAGMEVEQSLSAIGSVIGHVARDQLPALSRVPGIAAVEPERSIQLPPPDSQVQ